MTDFFISYTSVDEAWAEWIGFVLEEEGFSVVMQAWDFRPGSNFVLEMQKAAQTAERTIMVLSPDYLKSQFAAPEWAAAFATDPQGLKLKLVPVMIRSCQPDGLLASIVQIRIIGLDETAARQRLLAGLRQARAKPSQRPAFPGSYPVPVPKTFPGPAATGALSPFSARAAGGISRPSVLPKINRPPTDLDKRRFVQSGVAAVRELFEQNLAHAEVEDNRVQTDFQARSATEFRVEIFIDGQSACSGRIWLGGMHSENNICFAEGRMMSDTACNEIIGLADQGRSLGFHAVLFMGHYGKKPTFDTNNMTADEMASYLWDRFVAPLAHRS